MSEPIYISFSDVESFLRCRTMWDYRSANRQSIRHKTTPKLYLTLGSAVHKALEGQYEGKDPLGVVEKYMADEKIAKAAAYVEEFGNKPWGTEFREFDETAELARRIVAQYFDRYGFDNPLADQGLEYVGMEVPFKIDLSVYFKRRNIRGGEIEGPTVYFCGTLDGLAVDEHDGLFVVENKTYTATPDSEKVQWHWQTQGYAKALHWLTGLEISGGLYNGIAKKLISEPKVLKNGLLSTDKRQSVTLERYLDAISQNGEEADDPRFVDILQHLREIDAQGDTRFFYREKFFFTPEQLDAWETDFISIIDEMINDPAIYRTVPFNGCGDCWFSDLCHTQHSGGDTEYLLQKRYTTGTYGTVEEVKGVEPTTITSVDELREYLRND